MAEQYNDIFKDLKKHENELGTFIFSWIKDGTRYSFTEKTLWFEELEINLQEVFFHLFEVSKRNVPEPDVGSMMIEFSFIGISANIVFAHNFRDPVANPEHGNTVQ